MKKFIAVIPVVILLTSCATTQEPIEPVEPVYPELEARPDPYYKNMLPMTCFKDTDTCQRLPEEIAKAIVNGIAAMVMSGKPGTAL